MSEENKVDVGETTEEKKEGKHGNRPEWMKGERPELPKDENGNPMMPPHGFRPGSKRPDGFRKEDETNDPKEPETAEV